MDDHFSTFPEPASPTIASLLHILIVTPVIFLWLREREFKKGTLPKSLRIEEELNHRDSKITEPA